MGRRLVVCIDGTGNHPSDATEPGHATTNVFRLSEALVQDDEQIVQYFSGIGTTGWVLIDAKGEYTGFGARAIRDDAYEFLATRYQDGDRIYLFGFSRGAAIVRDLANWVNDHGLPGFRQPAVQMLGLWDTVAAFGVPIDLLGIPFQSSNIGKKLDIPSNVQQTYHLLAIDERRTPFIPTLIESADNVQEVWFAGVHADVGGGFQERRLADISLLYMMQCAESEGLRFIAGGVRSITGDSSVEEIMSLYALNAPINTYYGNLPQADRKITVRKDNAVSDLPPKIHWTVLLRVAHTDYRPSNVLALEEKFAKAGPLSEVV